MSDYNAKRLGYKKTPAGWIPKGWECLSLRSVSRLLSGGTPSLAKPEYWGGKIPWYSAKDLKTFRLRSSIEQVTEAGLKHGTREVPPNSILVLVRGMMLNRAFPVGVTTTRSCFNQDLKAVLTNQEHDPVFIAYLLVSLQSRFLSQVDRSSHGTGKLQTALLETTPLPIPPLTEQHKIVAILSTWDKDIEKTDDLIAAKRVQKKALMQQLLTGKRRLPGYAGEWLLCSIGSLFKAVSRPVKWDDDSTYKLLSVRRRSGGVFLRDLIRGSEILTKTMFIAHEGDFIISKMQVLHGATGLVPKELDGCHISGSYIALRPKGANIIDPTFFALLSTTPEFYYQTYLSSYGVHIEKMTFNLDWFLRSHVSIPSEMSEQKAIVEIFTTADREIASLEAKFVALKEQKKGLMQKLLTGEIRVS